MYAYGKVDAETENKNFTSRIGLAHVLTVTEIRNERNQGPTDQELKLIYFVGWGDWRARFKYPMGV